MKCVVTGCAGFIGSHLTDYLVEHGHQVRGLDALLPGRCNPANINPEAEFIETDVRDTRTQALLNGFDCVFHTAAVSTTPWAVADPVTCNDINVGGTVNLLEGARRFGVARFVFSSSNIVYAAETAYKASKLAAESYVRVYQELYGLSAVALRYSNVFGSLRQNPENCIMSMRESARSQGYVWLTGDGTQSRDFTSVHDICRANRLAADIFYAGPPLDICTGVNHTMNEVASHFGCRVEYRPARLGDIDHIVQDPRPARECLGFSAGVPFSEGMKEYL